jgi:type II secretory pathway pseudopilin PulG
MREAEAGYLLLTVVVMAALMLIALAVAAPVVAHSLQRTKEVESERRAEEYVRAIQLYQRACKCRSYPPSMDALEKSTTVRFLRQRYVDPLTGKSDWRVINTPKTTIKGFFGQELTGMTAGLGSAAGLASGVGTPVGGASAPGTAGTGSTTIGATSPLASGFGGATIGGSSGTGAAASGSSSPTSGSTTGMFGDSSGGVIYGVGTSRSGNSILTPNQQTTYETWEFWYDPRIELLKANVNILGGGGPAGSSTSGSTSGPSSTDASSFGQSLSGQSNAAPGTSGTSTGTTGATGSTGTTTPNPPQ